MAVKGHLEIKKNRYYAVIYYQRKHIWRSTGISAERGNKRKAEAVLSSILREYDENPNAVDKIKFTDYIRKWLDGVKNEVDIITYAGYKQYAEQHIIPYFEERRIILQNLTISDIEAYYTAKATGGRLDGKQGGLSLRTIKLHGVVLNLVLKKAMREQIIKTNPAEYAKYPVALTHKAKQEPEFYTVEQAQRLLEVTKGTPLHNMIYITFMYGLRRSELMGLRWDAVDFERDTIKINHTAVLGDKTVRKDSTKNETSRRTYPLLPEIRALLLDMRDKQDTNRAMLRDGYNESGYVFVHEDGRPYYPSYPTHELAKALKRNNLPHIRWHDLRHSCASMLIERGWHMKDISEWLGHADISTTMNIYGHISMEHKQELGKSLKGLLDKE